MCYSGSRGWLRVDGQQAHEFTSVLVAGDPTEWFTRFEICCNANEWSDVVKAPKLPPCWRVRPLQSG